jgi:hypothetical protein
MSFYKKIGLFVIWVLSIVAVGVLAHAQVEQVPIKPAPQLQVPAAPAPQLQAATVIAGNDLGFRVESHKGNTPVGSLVVRINGQWLEAQFSVGVKRVTACAPSTNSSGKSS